MKTGEIVIYGAGERGRAYLEFFQSKDLEHIIYGFCDKRYKEIKHIKNKTVYGYEEIKTQGKTFFISMAEQNMVSEVRNMLDEDGNKSCTIDDLANLYGKENNVEFNRELCACFHEFAMERYYESAESISDLRTFWGDHSDFLPLFRRLDISNVIELACGRGRHAAQYKDQAGHITLVDILQKNIQCCEKRYHDCDKITYYCNNGYNLEKLESERYTALFAYDAMVHFEMMDIYEYLNDIYRVLVPGGRALLHHSNNDKEYKSSFTNAPGGRAFMSKNVFAHLAYRCGFVILEQKVIDWIVKDLDCITLLEKISNCDDHSVIEHQAPLL